MSLRVKNRRKINESDPDQIIINPADVIFMVSDIDDNSVRGVARIRYDRRVLMQRGIVAECDADGEWFMSLDHTNNEKLFARLESIARDSRHAQLEPQSLLWDLERRICWQAKKAYRYRDYLKLDARDESDQLYCAIDQQIAVSDTC